MPEMLLPAVLVTGLCVALAVHSLMEARLSRPPALDEAMVRHFGVVASLLFIALSGPILVLRGWPGRPDAPILRLALLRSGALLLTVFWAASIGLVAIGLGGHVAGLAGW